MATTSDRNLLLGVLALQMDFVGREQLIAAVNSWIVDKSRLLDELLLEQGALAPDTHALLVALVNKHLELHGGDAEQSLASLSSIGSVRAALNELGDTDVDATLAYVARERDADDPFATEPFRGESSPHRGSRFRIVRPHAKGGLGEVFVARDDELNREVALKEIQSSHADSIESRSRFLLEAEVTGGLEHPGIVPVYGLGQYADGRPYYAMRFIRGDSLKEAIERFHGNHEAGSVNFNYQSLEFRKLLGRFIDVCNAVQYAHSRGVLHRDLKPGNIMLGKYGETLVVDWGLAKLHSRNDEPGGDDESTLRLSSASGSTPTLLGSAIGTPAYMPPEQAAGKLDEMGPESDVYSLGATLYHLLSGKPPVRGRDVGDVLRRVQQADFPPPSQIAPGCPAALNAICLRAMATRPRDRYPSPAELSEDVERFLADEPAAAHPESLVVRTRRWLRKHPKSVAAVAAALLVGIASTAAITAIVSNKNRELAGTNESLDATIEQLGKANAELRQSNEAEREAREEAVARKEEADAVRKFFEEHVLAAARPKDQDGGLGVDATIRAGIDAAEPRIAESFREQPLAEASIRNTVGLTYGYVGEAKLAIAQFERSRDLFAAAEGKEHSYRIVPTTSLGTALREAGRLDEAIAVLEQNVDEATAELGRDHRLVINTMTELGETYYTAGRHAESVELLEEVYRRSVNNSSLTQDDKLTSVNSLALSYRMLGRNEEAIPLLEQNHKHCREKNGADHPTTVTARNNLALAYQDTGRIEKAVPMLEESLSVSRAKLGADHPDTLKMVNNLASAYQQPKIGRIDEAIGLHKETLEALRKKFGTNHPYTVTSMNNLANAYSLGGKMEEAAELHEQTMEACRSALGPDHPYTLSSMTNLATAYRDLEQLDKATPLYEEAVRRFRAGVGLEHPLAMHAISRLARIYLKNEQSDKALQLLAEGVEVRRRQTADDQPAFAGYLAKLAADLLGYQQFAAAEEYARESLAIREQALPDSWLTFNARDVLGAALLGQAQQLMASDANAAREKLATAEPLLVGGYEGLRERQSQIPPTAESRLEEALRRLVELYTLWGKSDMVAQWQAELDAYEAPSASTN